MRIVQISDTHISARHDHFAANVAAVGAAVAGLRPDLFIHSGDVSMDGALVSADLDAGRAWLDRLAPETLAPETLAPETLVLPGNHDVGDLAAIRPDQPVDDARLARWRSTFGPDWWAREIGGWQVIGLDAMLFGTGHPDEAAQLAWLEGILQDARPIAIFMHKPICIDHPDEAARGYWTVAPAPRQQLLRLLAGRPVRLIASGHLHIERQRLIEGISHVWCPAASFVVGAMQEDLGGNRRLGYCEHTFDGDRVTTRFIRPDGLVEKELDAVRDEVYGG